MKRPKIKQIIKKLKFRKNYKAYIYVGILFVALLTLVCRGVVYTPPPDFLEGRTFSSPTYAQSEIRDPLRFNTLDVSDLSAEVVFAYNPYYYQVFASKNAEAQRPIASLTKMMTALVLNENFEATSTIPLSTDFYWMETSLGIYYGSGMEVQDVLETILIASKNDVAESISYSFTGENSLLALMNEKADNLGMDKTNYASVSGYFDDNNFSTARDLQKLIKEFMLNENFMNIVGMQSADVDLLLGGGSRETRTVYSTNLLLYTNPDVKGLKTGYTWGAGQCVVILADYGGNNKVVVIILNSQDRFGDAQRVLDRV